MDKKTKRETNGPGSTVERLDAYVSTGTKTGLAIWGNRLTWQTLFGYVPHFVEQLNTHRGVLEFLGGTFRDKKNAKLINPPQAFFSHQMEQMRASQVKLSQEVQSLTVRLQEEHSAREASERRAADLEAQLNSLKRVLLGNQGMMSSQQQPMGYGMDFGSNPANRLFSSQGMSKLAAKWRRSPVVVTQQIMLSRACSTCPRCRAWHPKPRKSATWLQVYSHRCVHTYTLILF